MAFFAVPKDGVIVNVIVADNKEDADLVTGADCIGYTADSPIGIGMTFNEETQQWGTFPEQPAE